MRLVAWNCNMALHRKFEALLDLAPDIAIVSETANPAILAERSPNKWFKHDPVWMGDNPHKGLGIFAFGDYWLSPAFKAGKRQRYIAPVAVGGPAAFNLLGVWAQNASAGITRKHQPGPLRIALNRYKDFLAERDSVVAGDWNSNAIWDKPGWRINHMAKVRALEALGLTSIYHERYGEAHGAESIPTHYWRDRREDGPTYHIDFAFIPRTWLPRVKHCNVGAFADWCGNRLSDHVPIVVEVDL